MEVGRSSREGRAHSGLPAGSQAFFLLLRNGPAFPGVCRGSSIKPLKFAARAAQGAGVGSENGEGEGVAKRGLEGGSEGGGPVP